MSGPLGATSEVQAVLKEVRIKMQQEIGQLEHELRVTLPKEIKKALEHGDLRENSEYKSALERQEYVKARLGQLKKRLSEIATMDLSRLPKDRVAYGSTVELENPATGDKTVFRLVMPEESDPDRGWVSVASPIGKGLVGREEGDDVEIRAPAGVKRYTIVSLRTVHDEDPEPAGPVAGS
jgi:transcription elongation factor GreA